MCAVEKQHALNGFLNPGRFISPTTCSCLVVASHGSLDCEVQHLAVVRVLCALWIVSAESISFVLVLAILEGPRLTQNMRVM
jgi:hypothetical protein